MQFGAFEVKCPVDIGLDSRLKSFTSMLKYRAALSVFFRIIIISNIMK